MKRIIKAFTYSCAGLKAAFKNEAAFRQECLLLVILVPIAVFSDTTNIEKILLISSILIVMIVELINSAIEAAIDRISDEKHPLSKIAKDTGSAAVLVTILNLIIVWGLVLCT